ALIAIYVGFLGNTPLHNFSHSLRLVVLLLLIPLFGLHAEKGKAAQLALYAAIGQAIAALHTVLEGAYPSVIPQFAHGKVSESGQLCISLFLALGLYLAKKQDTKNSVETFFVFGTTLTLGLFGLSPLLQLSPSIQGILGISALILLVFNSARTFRAYSEGKNSYALSLLLSGIILPLLGAALLINLKRGPWAGIAVAGAILAWRYTPRTLLFAIPTSSVLALTITPIRERITTSFEHFFIHGGRSTIWELGSELLLRYPLGIGLDNANRLNAYSSEIPAYLNHFHSNPINIAVELGWLGLFAYLWWMGAILEKGFRESDNSPEGKLLFATTCGILAWQVAGLVEFNFGDSEVFLLAMVAMGIVSAKHPPNSDVTQNPAHLL
ncbi:MAG: hypothetical protein KDD60_02860, partial [Bdellovibrionales bacterium]|nr:hypothetical protein [Bdellovibrionales bacterium]